MKALITDDNATSRISLIANFKRGELMGLAPLKDKSNGFFHICCQSLYF